MKPMPLRWGHLTRQELEAFIATAKRSVEEWRTATDISVEDRRTHGAAMAEVLACMRGELALRIDQGDEPPYAGARLDELVAADVLDEEQVFSIRSDRRRRDIDAETRKRRKNKRFR